VDELGEPEDRGVERGVEAVHEHQHPAAVAGQMAEPVGDAGAGQGIDPGDGEVALRIGRHLLRPLDGADVAALRDVDHDVGEGEGAAALAGEDHARGFGGGAGGGGQEVDLIPGVGAHVHRHQHPFRATAGGQRQNQADGADPRQRRGDAACRPASPDAVSHRLAAP